MDGLVIWLTGLPAAGKTTLAVRVLESLRSRGLKAEHLDGDELRKTLSQGLGFSREDRDKHIMRVGFVCRLLSRNGVVAIVSAISPYRATRDQVRKSVRKFIEVYVKCPLEVCEKRDPKGLYKKAREGKIPQVTGVNDPYEEPLDPELTLETEKETIGACVDKILKYCDHVNVISTSIYTPEEEKKLKERLSSLGYLE